MKYKLIKINIPGSFNNYINGAGECVDALASEKGFELYNNEDSFGERFEVQILQDSLYYDGLKNGEKIVVETRRAFRPVAVYSNLEEKFGESNWF